jgi:hypothetical protein
MGKNADQIQRLFIEDADVFLQQYGGQIANSVIQQMATYAQAKSALDRPSDSIWHHRRR